MRRPSDLDWPCNNVVPGTAPVAVVLARTEETVVAVTGIRAYPTGFGFTLNLRLWNLAPGERRGFWPFPEFGYHGGRTVPADAFQLTIQFADGRSVTNLDPAPSDLEVPAFEQPMLSSGPGTGLGGSGSSPDRWGWDMNYRVRPLPPPGPWPLSVCGRNEGSRRLASRSTARPSSGRLMSRCACGPMTRTAPLTEMPSARANSRSWKGNRSCPMSWWGSLSLAKSVPREVSASLRRRRTHNYGPNGRA